MKKELFEITAIDYLRGELNTEEKITFEEYLKKNSDAMEDFEELKASWGILNSLSDPETSEAMDTRFFDFFK